MFRHWLRFVQPLAVIFVVWTAVTTGLAQEAPEATKPPAEPAAAADAEAKAVAEAEKPAPPPAEAKEAPKPAPEAEAKPEPAAEPAKMAPEPKPDAEQPKEAAPAEPKEAPKPEPKAEPEPESPAKPAEKAAPKPEAEQPKEAAPAEPKEAPSPEPKAEPKPEPPAQPAQEAEPMPEAAADAGDPAGVFAAKLDEWKDALKELRRLRTEYRLATPGQVSEIQAKWGEAVARTEALIDPLRSAGVAAYRADPNADDELAVFLVKLVADDVARDDYEPAFELAKTLLDNGCTKQELFDPAARAAFATNDFDAAEAWFKKAQEAGTLSDASMKAIGEVASYREFWAEEQKIRQKEAAQDDLPRVRLSTNTGDIVIELFENEAPGAVGNFVSLVKQNFYDGLTFHRVLPGFMAQGGCPRGDGTGDAGYKIYCECHQDNYRKHFRGTLSMAHAGRDTGGSQFFLTFVPTSHLNGQHTAFGRVIEGMEVLAKLQRIDPQDTDAAPIADRIVTAEVIRDRGHEYQPRKVDTSR